MSFSDNTHEKKRNFPPKLPQETMTFQQKADLWRTLTNQMTQGASNTNTFLKQARFPLEDKARRFGECFIIVC